VSSRRRSLRLPVRSCEGAQVLVCVDVCVQHTCTHTSIRRSARLPNDPFHTHSQTYTQIHKHIYIHTQTHTHTHTHILPHIYSVPEHVLHNGGGQVGWVKRVREGEGRRGRAARTCVLYPPRAKITLRIWALQVFFF